MLKRTTILAILLAALTSVDVLHSQHLGIKPGIARTADQNLSVGLNLDAEYLREVTFTSEYNYPRILSFEAKAEGSVFTKPDFNTKTQLVDLFFGYLVSFKKAQDLVLGQEPTPTRDYGSLGLGLSFNYQASQMFEEQFFNQGIEFRYINSSLQFIPVFEGRYSVSKPIQSDIRGQLNAPDNYFRQLNLRLFWVVQFRQILLNPDFRYFQSQGLDSEIENAGFDEGYYSSISLGYQFEEIDSGIFSYLSYIYLQYNYGQLPVHQDNRETLEAGIRFSF